MTAIDDWIADLRRNRISASDQPVVGTITTCILAWQQVLAALGGGTVTSVGLALPAEFTVTGSPVTTTGTLTAAWANEAANTALMGPASGAAATPSFRSLTAADIPATLAGQVLTQGLTGTSPGWYAQIIGDATPRVRVGLNASDTASLALGSGAGVRDTFLERAAAASLRMGTNDAAAPAAQTLSVQNVLAGTVDTPGAALTIDGSRGTGAGAGGAIVFQTAPAGGAGSTQNPLTPALTLNGDATANFPTTVGMRALSFTGVSGSFPTNGVYESSTNVIAIITGGSNRVIVASGSTTFTGNAAGQAASSWFAINLAASATQPTLVPNQSNLRAGLGSDVAGDVSVIVDVGGTPTESMRFTNTATINRAFPLILKGSTVGNLPGAGTFQGALGFVSDSTLGMTAGSGLVVVGGGANIVPVFCDGTNWRIM